MLAGITLTRFSLWYGQNNHLMPVSATADSSQVDGLFNTMLTVATGLFLLVQGVLIYAIFRFRQRPGDDSDGPPIHGNIPLEVLWTSIPAVIVLAISIYSFEVYNNMGGLDPMASGGGTMMAHHHGDHHGGAAIAAPLDGDSDQLSGQPLARQVALGIGAGPDAQGQAADLAVDVLGLQYAWLFTYPNGFLSGELHLPKGADVQLNITAQDVLHAFWVPQFRLKQDAIPGKPTQLRFTPTVAGTYPIVCAELCGAYHGAMRAEIVVEEPEEYEAWMASMLADAGGDRPITVAARPVQDLTPSEFLQPYADELQLSDRALDSTRDRLTAVGS